MNGLLRVGGSLLIGFGLTALACSGGGTGLVLLGLATFAVGLNLWHDAAHQPDRPKARAIREGDAVNLRAKVYRADRVQALIEFTSMEGTYSIRVPLSEVRRR
jgi:hypothetical protein